tara:strand:+ start:37 stop:225 length:189 start_codon:yes stop_codon:yes gene_type:complete
MPLSTVLISYFATTPAKDAEHYSEIGVFSSPGLLIDKADWEQIGLIEINALGPTLRAVVLVT